MRGPSARGARCSEVAQALSLPSRHSCRLLRRPPGRRSLDTVRRTRQANATKSWRAYCVLRPSGRETCGLAAGLDRTLAGAALLGTRLGGGALAGGGSECLIGRAGLARISQCLTGLSRALSRHVVRMRTPPGCPNTLLVRAGLTQQRGDFGAGALDRIEAEDRLGSLGQYQRRLSLRVR